ncbi:hypothetical protein ACFL6E_01420 [Candidatus Neomarinimicrobiota bacterium]
MSVGNNINNLFDTGKSRPNSIADYLVLNIIEPDTAAINATQEVWHNQVRPWGSGLISIGDIRFWLRLNEESFKGNIIKTLWRNGISITSDLRIYLAQDDALAVRGENVDRVKIEAVINKDAYLFCHFLLLASTDSFITAIDGNSDFAANYCANPEEAMNNFNALYSSDRWYRYQLSTSNLMGPLSSSIN